MTKLSRRPLLCLVYLTLPIGCGGELPGPVEGQSPAGGAPSLHQRAPLLLDDHGDISATATPVQASASPFTGTLEDSFDKDVFSFQAKAQHFYRFQCTFPSLRPGWQHDRIDARNSPMRTEVVWSPPGRGLYFKAVAQEVAYVRLSARTFAVSGPYSCQLVDLGADDHGDTLATATPWVPDTLATGVLELREDRDAFAIPLPRGAFYRVSCDSPTFTPCQVNVAAPSGVGTGFLENTATFNATHPGDYLVEVATAPGTDVVIRGAYSLRLEHLEDDDHADTSDNATRLAPSPAPFSGKLSGSVDRDVFAFTALQGHVYRFACDILLGRSLGPTLVLRDRAGQYVEGSSFVEGMGTSVAVEAPAAADYFVELSHGAYEGPYRCRFEELGFDDHGDSATQATEVSLSTLLTGRIETRSDVDVFTFPLRPGHSYRFQWVEGTASNTSFQLNDAQGKQLQFSTLNWMVHEATEEAMYQFEVKLSQTWGTGTYAIQATDLGPDDHANLPEGATLLEVGQTLPGWRHRNDDVDVFVFHVEENNLYRLTCSGCGLVFLQPFGKVLPLHVANPDSYLLDAIDTGPVHISVVSGSSYQLSLAFLGKDDHGDDTARATPITFPLRLSALMETPFDTDVFSVNLRAGQPHRVNAGGHPTMVVTVLDPEGQEVPKTFEGDFTPRLPGIHHLRVKTNVGYDFRYGAYQLAFD
ncbi:hypothetical protein HUA78_33815 [Myxococcus sp. CA033]|uniref:hypothetical protein n=1 Tax=Myxococcus sp. CA033 TaxID=2741516 RepID=UPI00157B2B86|nr:hypothetical protein [Myxococcus sp. CA033]NTX39425.1 hypothetical protein [Myxococcus sp. CA033]